MVTINGTAFDFTGAVVDYTVSATGVYDIIADGAQGGYATPGGIGPGGGAGSALRSAATSASSPARCWALSWAGREI